MTVTITQLADLVQSTPFQQTAFAESVRRSVLFGTGIVRPDAELDRMCKSDVGNTFEFDYFKDLADDASNVGSDDPATSAAANKVTAVKERAHLLHRNQGWGVPNLLKAMSAAGDPNAFLSSRVGAYWARQYDIFGIAALLGVIADNVANDSGDMVNNITAVSMGQKPTFDAFADTMQTMGDRQDDFQTIIMHSAVANVLLKDQVTNKVYDASGRLLYQSLLAKRIVISDSVYTNSGNYDSYIFKDGAMGFGLGNPAVPEEVYSAAAAGNGEGVRTFWSRRHISIHPYGFDFIKGSVAGISATDAELAAAANWNRIKLRKQVGIAVLRTKLANS